jgi:hypothetical protein
MSAGNLRAGRLHLGCGFSGPVSRPRTTRPVRVKQLTGLRAREGRGCRVRPGRGDLDYTRAEDRRPYIWEAFGRYRGVGADRIVGAHRANEVPAREASAHGQRFAQS